MPGLGVRLKRLEQASEIGVRHRACPECGRLPGGRFPDDGSAKWEVSFADEPEPDIPDFCTSCGGQRVYRLCFDDRG